jgi:hypothetical protein
MNLEQIFVASAATKAKAAPTVSINYHNGRMRFNVATVELLEFKESDMLAFFHDRDSPKDYYFMKSKGAGAHPFIRDNNSKGLSINNAKLVRPMLEAMGITRPVQLYISEEKVDGKYWKILSDKIVK